MATLDRRSALRLGLGAGALVASGGASRLLAQCLATSALSGDGRPGLGRRAYCGEAISVRTTGSGPDIVFIPGKGSSGAVWQDVAERLANRYRVHLVYMRGFAGEPSNPALNAVIEPVARDLHRYLTTKKIRRASLVGHSLGGTIALALSIVHPDLVGRIMLVEAGAWMPKLIDPNADFAKIGPVATADRARLIGLSSADFDALQARIVGNWVAEPDKQRLLLHWLQLCDRRTLANAGYDLFTTDLRPRLGAITAPVQIVTGWWPGATVSQAGLIERFEDQFARLASRHLVVIPDSRHFIMFDQPERLLAQIEAFLGEPAHRAARPAPAAVR